MSYTNLPVLCDLSQCALEAAQYEIQLKQPEERVLYVSTERYFEVMRDYEFYSRVIANLIVEEDPKLTKDEWYLRIQNMAVGSPGA